MDTNVIDLAKDKKIADFADVVKQKLKQKLADNDFVKSTKDELEKIQSISKSLTDISNKGKDAETKSDDDTKTDVENKTDDEVKTTDRKSVV